VSNVPRVLALGFSPQGEWLAVGGEGERLQVRRESGQSVFLESRDAGIAKLVFSSDGKWLAAGGSYGGTQLWRWEGTKTNPAPILLSGHTELVNSIGFSPRGILSAAADGTVRFWELDPKKLIDLACQRAGRPLSNEEWSTYLPTETYEEGQPCPELPQAFD
jgi:WD40 repeat protein